MKEKGFFTKRLLSSLIVVVVGILLYVSLSNFTSVSSAVKTFFSVLSPFTAGIAIAYLLNMPARFFEAKVFKNFRKKYFLSILVTYVLAILILTLLLGMIIPQLVESISSLIANIQGYFDNINRMIAWVSQALNLDQETADAVLVSYKDLVNQLVAYARSILPQILSISMRVGTGIVSALTAFIASIYMLGSKKTLVMQCRRVAYAILPERHAYSLMRVSRLSNEVFSGFIGGKLIDSAIIGLICFVFMSLANLGLIEMPYALLISVIVGVTNIIPFFGPFIGAVPSVLILLMVNPWSAFWFGIFIIVLQQFDGNYLGPKILGNSTGLPAIWVLIAIVTCGGLFGFMGMVLGVPFAAVVYTLIGDFVKNRLQQKGLTNDDIQEYKAPGAPMIVPNNDGIRPDSDTIDAHTVEHEQGEKDYAEESE